MIIALNCTFNTYIYVLVFIKSGTLDPPLLSKKEFYWFYKCSLY